MSGVDSSADEWLCLLPPQQENEHVGGAGQLRPWTFPFGLHV
jgi:hypothetical protein